MNTNTNTKTNTNMETPRSTRRRLTAAAAALAVGILGATASAAGAAVPGFGSAPPTGYVTASAAHGVPAPGKYVPAAWLTAGQMPLAQPGVTTWVPTGGAGTKLGGDVYEASLPQVMACDSLGIGGALAAGLGKNLAGTQYDTYDGSNSDKILPSGAIPAYADQYALFYANSTQASAAMKGLAADYASCAHEVTGIDPTTGGQLVGSDASTVNQGSVQCWSLLSAPVSGPAGNATVDHLCFVQSGSVIGIAGVSANEVSTLSTICFGPVDSATISSLHHALSAYNAGN